ncbi:MAG TPA: hypothetical protein VIG07_10015 [Methylomirabilota bacterium]|jgi:hypothetical protein
MSKPPGVFSLLATAVTGFGSHLVSLCVTARDQLINRRKGKGRQPGR